MALRADLPADPHLVQASLLRLGFQGDQVVGRPSKRMAPWSRPTGALSNPLQGKSSQRAPFSSISSLFRALKPLRSDCSKGIERGHRNPSSLTGHNRGQVRWTKRQSADFLHFHGKARSLPSPPQRPIRKDQEPSRKRCPLWPRERFATWGHGTSSGFRVNGTEEVLDHLVISVSTWVLSFDTPMT